jgi:Fe-S oxidoreductase
MLFHAVTCALNLITMKQFVVAPNQLAKERLAAGISEPGALAARAGIDPEMYEHIEAGRLLPTLNQFERLRAALGDVPADRLYRGDMLQIMGAITYAGALPTPRSVMDWVGGPMKLFVARDEVTWMQDTREIPDEPVDAFITLSCGTRATPHLLLDALAAARALGITFVAASGPAGCCGKPYLAKREFEAGDAFTLGKVRYAQRIGASTIVTSCHACMQTATIMASRRQILEGTPHPVREMWMGNFLAERVARLGDQVPWKRRLTHRVLLDEHTGHGAFIEAAQGMAQLLSLIPGAEVVGSVSGELESVKPCGTPGRTGNTASGAMARPQWRPVEVDRREAEVRARLLADLVSARGADTVSATHFSCHNMWSRYASDRMKVRHCVSLLAEALGVGHPDRAQAAAHIGDPIEVVQQTRPIWGSWNLTEEEALALASDSIYPKDAGPMGCSCDVHDSADFIPIDILRGVSPGLSPVG